MIPSILLVVAVLQGTVLLVAGDTGTTREFWRNRLAAGCVIVALAFATGALWTVYAVQVNDWRFAAVYWVPFAMGWLGRTLRPKQEGAR